MKIHTDNAEKDSGRFLFWRWSLWSIGGGSGVEWYFFDRVIYPGERNILWVVFNIQRRVR